MPILRAFAIVSAFVAALAVAAAPMQPTRAPGGAREPTTEPARRVAEGRSPVRAVSVPLRPRRIQVVAEIPNIFSRGMTAQMT